MRGVQTDAGTIEADEVVIAAGTGSAELLAGVGVALEIDTPAGLLVHSRPHAPLLNGLVIGDVAHVRQTAEGRIVAGSDFGGTEPGDDAAATARALFAAVREMLAGADELALDFHTIGYRPMPADGFPIIGRPAGLAGPLCHGHAFRRHAGAGGRPLCRRGNSLRRPQRALGSLRG